MFLSSDNIWFKMQHIFLKHTKCMQNGAFPIQVYFYRCNTKQNRFLQKETKITNTMQNQYLKCKWQVEANAKSDRKTKILLLSNFSGELVVIRETGKGAQCRFNSKNVVSSKILWKDRLGGRRSKCSPIHLLTHCFQILLSASWESICQGLPVLLLQQWGLHSFCDSCVKVVLTELALPCYGCSGVSPVHP